MTNAAALAAKLGLGGDYPNSWDEFVGQAAAKRQLQIAARSAKARGVPMGHFLLQSGTPGIGKTTLALCCAAEMDTRVHIVTGKMNFKQARVMLLCCEPGDIIFIDEIHSMFRNGGGSQSEWLLHLLENGVLLGPSGVEEIPPVTVIGATTDAGRLLATVLSRFTKVELVAYTDDEADQIARVMADRMLTNPPLSDDMVKAVARAASNNPRMIRTILSNIRDLAVVEGIDSGYNFDEALDFLGLSPDGLDRTAQRYLWTIYNMHDGQAGEKAMRDTLQEPGGLAMTEYVLKSKGFLVMTGQGRQLTSDGIRRAREFDPERVASTSVEG